jgi:nucleoid-associated protein YgaU
MTNVLRLSVIALLLGALLVPAFAQQEMTKEEWQKQVTELTAKVTDLKATFENAKKEVADLQKQLDDKAAALKKNQEELAALMGEQEKVLQSDMDKIEGRLSELSRLSNQELYARRAELDEVQKWIEEAKKNPASGVGTHSAKLDDQMGRLDAMKKSMEQYVASGQAMQTYTVGTWAKDRDCLWNIAKKPKIYDNPFMWPKIWQGNRDQIKNPDVIQPGQKLKIPPKADLTKEEKSAVRKYWSKKEAAAAPAK